MADKIFGQGLRPVPFKLVEAPEDTEFPVTEPRPMYIVGLGDLHSADQGAAVEDATDETDVVDTVNALLASLRAAGIIAP